MANGKREATLSIDGQIVTDTEEGVSGKQFRQELQQLGEIDKLLLHISSLGGALESALAIHGMLLELKAEKTARIAGAVASAATIIAAACTVEMRPHAMMLIHFSADCPPGYLTAEDHFAAAEDCLAWDESMVKIYAVKTGQLPSEIRAQMRSNAWMNAETCRDFGLADTILPDTGITASIDPQYPHLWSMDGRRLDFTGFTSFPVELLDKPARNEFERQQIIAAAKISARRIWGGRP
jgi:ATP-dependent protease ClpP protease subunit